MRSALAEKDKWGRLIAGLERGRRHYYLAGRLVRDGDWLELALPLGRSIMGRYGLHRGKPVFRFELASSSKVVIALPTDAILGWATRRTA